MKVEYRRQLIHISGALFVLPLQIFGKELTAIGFAIMMLVMFLIGKHRLRNRLKSFEFIKDYSRESEFPMKGALTFLLGMLFVVLLFPESFASAAIVVLAVGDSVSTIIGKKFGKHKLLINKQKSFEGSLAFFAAAVIILWFFDPYRAVYVAIGVTLVEMLPIVDDNLTVPLATAMLLAL